MLGCAHGDDAPAFSSDDPLAQATSGTLDAGVGPYFSEVAANGTACPKGTWQTLISPDGSLFTTQFSAYEVTIEGSQRLSAKDCNLTVKLRSDAPLQYALSEHLVYGYAFLENGVTGFALMSHYFQGDKPAPSDDRVDLAGPMDRSWRFAHSVPDEDLVWSRCGRSSNLQILSRLALRKSQNAGSGYATIDQMDTGGPGDTVRFKLKSRPCVEEPVDAGTPPSADVGSLDAGS